MQFLSSLDTHELKKQRIRTAQRIVNVDAVDGSDPRGVETGVLAFFQDWKLQCFTDEAESSAPVS